MKPHPSGRPRQTVRKGIISRWNVPRDDYVTPRLQKGEQKEAIGFTVEHLPGADLEELY